MKFKTFLLREESRPSIKATGHSAERHKAAYIDPFVGSEEHSHKLSGKVDDLEKGHSVRITHAHVEDGKTHVRFQAHGKGDKEYSAPASKLQKPGKAPPNQGHSYEENLVAKLHKHGIARPETAGSTAGSDMTLIRMHKILANKKKQKITGEIKQEANKAAFGQITLRHTEKHGWHIPEKNRQNRPTFAKHAEEMLDSKHPEHSHMTVRQYMNKHHHPDNPEKPKPDAARAKTFTVDHHNMHPAEAYLQDHHVDVLQIGGGHGLYKAGKHDPTGHGLPRLKGPGRFTIRQKTDNPSSRTIQFSPRTKTELPKSHVNLDHDEHIAKFAHSMGHHD